MKLIESLKGLFGGKAKEPVRMQERIEPNVDDHNILIEDEPQMIFDEQTGITVETDDPLMARVAAEAMRSGQVIISHRDGEGNFTIEKIEKPNPKP